MTAFKLLLWPFITRHWIGIGSIVVIGFINCYCKLLLPLSIGRYIDLLFGIQTNKGRALSLVGIHLAPGMTVFFIFFFAVLLIRLLTSWAERYLNDYYADGYVSQLRQQLFRRHLSGKANGENISTDALTAYSGDMKTQQQWLTKGVTGFVRDFLFIILSMYILFALQPALSSIALLFLPLLYGIHKLMNAYAKADFKHKRKQQAALFGYIADQLMPMQETADNAEQGLREKNNNLSEANKRYNRKAAFQQAITPTLLYMMLGILMIVLAWAPSATSINSSDTITYILLLLNAFPTLRNILRTNKIWSQARVSSAKFLKKEPTIRKLQKVALLKQI